MKTRPRHSPIAVWLLSALAGTGLAGTEYLSDQLPPGKTIAVLGLGTCRLAPQTGRCA